MIKKVLAQVQLAGTHSSRMSYKALTRLFHHKHRKSRTCDISMPYSSFVQRPQRLSLNSLQLRQYTQHTLPQSLRELVTRTLFATKYLRTKTDDSQRYWDELLELFADKSIRCPHEILDKTNTLS